MKRFFNVVILIAVIGGLGYFVWHRCNRKNGTETKETTFNIYLISDTGTNVEGEKTICNDIVTPVSKTVIVEKSEIEAAMNELFAQRDTLQLHNYIQGPGLLLFNVSVADNVAEVYITGDFRIQIKCDIDRIHHQLYDTAKQFKDLQVKFYINNEPLDNYLAIAEKGFQ
ncbi:MAG: GerMN domain-containing protein [Bacteroidetes bacterium]|nr:GerMN domain-containing protein [Bacteroidota bacterium]